MSRNLTLIWNGLIPENPIFRLALSLCPAVGMTTSVKNGALLGVAVIFVQVFSSCTVAIFKNYIHPRIRIPTYVLIIALWTSVMDMVLPVFAPETYKQVELFIKLIVVFAIIISRLELFASKEPLTPSFFDGLGMGLGFMFGLVVLGVIREFLGAGSLWGYEIMDKGMLPILIQAAGGFFVIGFIMALLNWVEYKITGKIPASGGGH